MKRESTRAKRPVTVPAAGSALPSSCAMSATPRAGGSGHGEQTISKYARSTRKIFAQNSVELETWAASRIKPWKRPSKGDYDFRSWMNKNEALLKAGCIYEYARES